MIIFNRWMYLRCGGKRSSKRGTRITALNMCGFPQSPSLSSCGDQENEPLMEGTNEGSGWGCHERG